MYKYITIIAAALGGLAAVASTGVSLLDWFQVSISPKVFREIKKYSATIEPKDSSLEEFILREEVVLSVPISTTRLPSGEHPSEKQDAPRRFRIRERALTSSRSGFLTRRLFFLPLGVTRDEGWKELDAAGEVEPIYLLLDDYHCDDVNVELRNLPAGSFDSATDSEKLERHPFSDVENVQWSVKNLEPSIGVSFIKPGFEKYRPILSPFIGLSSINGWVAASIVLAFTVVVVIVVDIAKDSIKAWLGERKREDATPAK
jgi:hypothetical protein